jgi:Pyruvate/2-oxoacid:ferredoxin oxidoreductase gamma subunit
MSRRMEIRFGGLGGQGVILAGEILGRAAVYDDKNVVQTQSYGAEARGSAAKSEIIVSDRKIWFPFVRCCDVLVVMSQSALPKISPAKITPCPPNPPNRISIRLDMRQRLLQHFLETFC